MSQLSLLDDVDFQNWEQEFIETYPRWKRLNDKMNQLKSEGKGFIARVEEPMIATDRVMIKTGSSNRFDSKRFRSEWPRLYEDFMRTSYSVTITPVR